MENSYKPISCSFYDQLETFAVKKIKLEIEYIENNEKKKTQEFISNFKTSNKEEFLILSNGLEIRLDNILKVYVL